MKNLFKILPLASLLFLQSCATIVSGSRQTIQFNSKPANATVYINEVEAGKTPLAKDLERKQEYDIKIQLDGYQAYETKLTKKFNEWYIGNILFGGIIGLVVDPITGAIYKLTPKDLNATMASENKKKKDDVINISVRLEIAPEWEQVGQLLQAD